MTMFQSTYGPLIAGLLPALFSTIAVTLAGFLRQDGWSDFANAAIAFVTVLGAALFSVYIAGGLTTNSGLNAILAAVEGSFTLLLSGTFKPLQNWLHFLQSNVLVVAPGPADSTAGDVPVVSTQTVTTRAVNPPQPLLFKKPTISDVSGAPTTTEDHSG